MISTPRLTVRPFQEEDAPALYAYLSLAEIYRFEPGGPISLAEATTLASQRAQGWDFWAVVLTATQEMVGHLYFAQTDPKEWMTWELGYIFHPAHQKRGYATESASALIRYGFAHLGIHRVIARCNPDNIASWKVLEKLGMRREGHFCQNAFFHRDADGKPLWTDTFEYAVLAGELVIGDWGLGTG